MKNPFRLHPCAHTFCQKCLPTVKKCPKCQGKVTSIQKDLTGLALVNEMPVRCLNEGCPYSDNFDNYKRSHMKNCRLKSGLDDWLKNMKSTLDDHSNNPYKRKYSSENESGS
jgi:DNA-directed RNA polymerase subunit N (RpoN/RPB10)